MENLQPFDSKGEQVRLTIIDSGTRGMAVVGSIVRPDELDGFLREGHDGEGQLLGVQGRVGGGVAGD